MKFPKKAFHRAGRSTLVAIALAAFASASAFAGDRPDKGCSEATIRGEFGSQIQGTRPVPGGGTESVIGVVWSSFDGHGNVEQTDNVKGSVSGLPVQDRPGFGTYEVNADCTGTMRFEPGPGIHLEQRFVIVDNGNEIRSITSAPAGVNVSAVAIRIRQR